MTGLPGAPDPDIADAVAMARAYPHVLDAHHCVVALVRACESRDDKAIAEIIDATSNMERANLICAAVSQLRSLTQMVAEALEVTPGEVLDAFNRQLRAVDDAL